MSKNLAYFPHAETAITIKRAENGDFILTGGMFGVFKTEVEETAFKVLTEWIARQNEIVNKWKSQDMSKKNVNPSDLTIRTCYECGKQLHYKNSNVCRECLERILAEQEFYK